MKRIISLSVMVLLCSCMLTRVTAQGTNKPVALKYKRLYVGDKMPDVVFKNIINYPKKNPRVSDFKGKLIILDFWFAGCGSCIKAFPKMEKLQHQFDDKIQVIFINAWETMDQINKEFQRVKKYRPSANVYIPSLPGVNGDTMWQTLFRIVSMPTHVWIDSSGTIIAITQGYNATPEHIQSVLDGKIPNMVVKDDVARWDLLEKGYIQPSLPTMPPVYYSAFVPYYSSGASFGLKEDTIKGTFKRTFCNESPIELFNEAFSNYDSIIVKPKVIIEITNQEQYERPIDDNLIDDWNSKYLFTYEVQTPLKGKQNWQSIMQQDLNRFFGSLFGIEGKIEKRQYKDEGVVDVLVIKDKS